MNLARNQTASTRRPRDVPSPREEVGFWSAVAAGALVILAVVRLFQWGNRWYIVEQFTKTAEPGESWAWYYGLLHSAHSALVTAIACLLGAAALIAVSWWARRGSRAGYA